MIDIHTHLIPNIDDGSASLTESVAQLNAMQAGGITRAYLTSHYFRGHYHYSRSEYDQRVADLKEAAAGIDIDLISGFEIFLQPGIADDISSKKLTLGDSNYILIESELNGLPSDFYANVFPLLRAGYKPILAHAERYVSIMKKPVSARSLSDKDVYIQTNAGSLLGMYGEKVRRTAWILVENGWTHFVASDDHVRGSYDSMFEAYRQIQERIDTHTANLLCKDFPASIESNEKIPYSYVMVKRTHHRKKSWLRRLFG